MTLEEQCRLSCYKKISAMGTHSNVLLVQHVESQRIYVKKVQRVYNKDVYQTLMKLHDRHIPQIYECVEDDGQLTIIEEYVQGESLSEHIQKNGVYTETEVVSMIQTLCRVLDLLHHFHPPIIHRDLKPENIIMTNDGILKLVDFNTAKQFRADQESDTVLIGTREFAAPEQYGFAQSDARTDIYALGVMINYLLTGRYPKEKLYHSENDQKRYRGGALADIIGKCTAFSPDMRYQDISELQKALSVSGVPEKKTDDRTQVTKEIEGQAITKQRHPLLPPGFRSGHLWKMVVGTMGYLLIFWLCLTTEYTDSHHAVMTGFVLWVNRICVLIGCLLSAAVIFNYRNVQKYLPFPKNHRFRIPVSCLYVIVIFFIMAGISTMLT